MEAETLPSSESHLSDAQLAANRANAQLSTGPRTDEGKAISSMNACKHNLSGGPALTPDEDPAEYAKHHALIEEDYGPGTEKAKFVVHQIADVMWRLKRLERMSAELAALSANPFTAADDDLAKRTERLERHRQNLERSYCRFSREWRALVNDDRAAERHETDMERKRDKAGSATAERQLQEYLFAPPPRLPSVEGFPSRAFQSRDREGAVPNPTPNPPQAPIQNEPNPQDDVTPSIKKPPRMPKMIWKRRKHQPQAA